MKKNWWRSTLSPEAATALIHATRPTEQPSYDLTEREMEVLNLVVQGQSNQQIADHLVISLATVKAHISSILSKLEVSSRAEASAFAIKHKIVSILNRVPYFSIKKITFGIRKKYKPKDTSKLLGGWMRPRSFSSIVETVDDTKI